jgi:hypothetical protein
LLHYGNPLIASSGQVPWRQPAAIAGLSVPVGDSCQTSPFSVSLSSGSGFAVGGGGPVSGSYTIPLFRHCGLNTLLLNLTIPGSGNTLNLTLGQLQLG